MFIPILVHTGISEMDAFVSFLFVATQSVVRYVGLHIVQSVCKQSEHRSWVMVVVGLERKGDKMSEVSVI